MCRPTYFAVDYAINPWMDPTRAVDTRRWPSGSGTTLRDTYLDLGHTVEEIDPIARPARHGLRRQRRDRGRRPRAAPCSSATRSAPTRARPTGTGSSGAGFEVHEAKHVNEGEGDLLLAGDVLLAGTGFRTDARRARRGAGGLRPAGDHAAAGRPALLPPRHRAVRARRGRPDRVPARGVLAGQPGGAAPAVPGRGARHARRRGGARASTRSATASTSCCRRRPPAWRGSCASAGYEHDRCRHVRAAQGRRRPQVLHPGGPEAMIVDDMLRTPTAVARRRALDGAQLPPAAGRDRRRPRAPGSPTSTAGATSTAWPATRR